MAEAVVNLLIKHLAPLLVDEFKLLGGVRQQVVQINDDLNHMTAFLKDAEKKQDTEEGVKEWVKQVREMAFATEDVIDEFLLQMGAPHRPGFTGFLRRSTRFIRHLRARHQIAAQIQNIKLRSENILEGRTKFSFQASNQGPSSSSSPSIDLRGVSSLYVEESELVGTNNNRNELTKRLIDGEPSLTVISVFGEGGVGKTTLVRKVFENKGVKAHFSCYAWITVSQSFDAKNILKRLIKQQYYKRKEKPDLPEGMDTKRMEEPDLPQGMDTMDYDGLVATLREYLEEKRYVVVLDDIWSEKAWDELKCAFPRKEKGSRIFVTTRKHEVALHCSDSQENVYPFKPLPPPDAWELFCKKTFRGTCPPNLKGVCEKIVNRCGGLPLAIVAIGAFLWKKNIQNLLEWELVYGTLGTEIVTDDTLKTMSRILWLSYNDLPDHLKSCFLYFSHFPEDYSVKCARVTRMWVAEGFIKPDRKNIRTLEEIAKAYLNELVTRSLIQVSKVDCYGRVERCRVHDLIRELILQKAEEENFCMSLAEENTRLHDKTRRLSIYNGESVVFSKDDCRFLLGVRSLFILRVSNNPALLYSFRLLKVLTLKGKFLERFPSEIVNLFHLRYLNMRRTHIKKIPNSIEKLQNLQTLDLKYTWVKELPKGILKLKQLRHLLVGQRNFFNNLITKSSAVELPAGIGHLNCLEKLSSMHVTNVKNREVVKEIGKLRKLRRLGISGLRREDAESLFESISNTKELQSLYICGSSNFPEHFDVSFLSKYSLPLLRSIELAVPVLNLTDLMPLFQNLVKLKVRASRLRDDPLKSLHYLPYLAFLRLSWSAYKGEELSCEGGGFRSLRVLYIEELYELRYVRFEEGAMPLLEKLSITWCRSLEELPIGIEYLTSLKDLNLWRNSNKLDEIITRSEGKIGPHRMDISELNLLDLKDYPFKS